MSLLSSSVEVDKSSDTEGRLEEMADVAGRDLTPDESINRLFQKKKIIHVKIYGTLIQTCHSVFRGWGKTGRER